jgi:hypothetical protein
MPRGNRYAPGVCETYPESTVFLLKLPSNCFCPVVMNQPFVVWPCLTFANLPAPISVASTHPAPSGVAVQRRNPPSRLPAKVNA